MANETVKIWHAENTRDSFFYRNDGNIYSMNHVKEAIKIPGNYKLVHTFRDIKTQNSRNFFGMLDEAYALSQNLGEPWKPPYRSTSVGDILEHRGLFYVVAPTGFDEIPGIGVGISIAD